MARYSRGGGRRSGGYARRTRSYSRSTRYSARRPARRSSAGRSSNVMRLVIETAPASSASRLPYPIASTMAPPARKAKH